jgi:hypothetical protein
MHQLNYNNRQVLNADIVPTPEAWRGTGIAESISDGIRARWPGFDIWRGKSVYLLHSIQTGSGAHSAGTMGKAAGAWSWPHLHPVQASRMVELCLHSPIRTMKSWGGVELQLHLGSLCWCVVNFTPLPISPDGNIPRGSDGPQSRSGHFGEEKIFPLTGIEPRPSSSWPVTIPTALPRQGGTWSNHWDLKGWKPHFCSWNLHWK